MPIANLADQTPRYFIFLTFTRGVGWRWSQYQWMRTFDALSIAAAPAPGVQETRVYYWDGAQWSPAFPG
jgi:hypothetical protein